MGRPVRAETLRSARETCIPAATGAGLRIAAGEYVQIVDVDGRGCADFFALATSNPAEYLSASHTRVQIDRLFPQVGQSFFSSLCRPMLQFEQAGRRASTTCSSRHAIRPGTPSTTSPVTPRVPRTSSARSGSSARAVPWFPSR
jgi:uncharacterized protein YcgI (DUF1989 family)